MRAAQAGHVNPETHQTTLMSLGDSHTGVLAAQVAWITGTSSAVWVSRARGSSANGHPAGLTEDTRFDGHEGLDLRARHPAPAVGRQEDWNPYVNGLTGRREPGRR